jgi:FkbM family methyltransferase
MKSIKGILKKIFRSIGFEVNRYNALDSDSALLQQFLVCQQIDLVLDVGANTGQYASMLRNLGYKNKIISFEPQEEAYSYLSTNSAKDKLWDIAPRSAIGAEDDEIVINLSKNSFSSSVLPILDSLIEYAPETEYFGKETVPLFKLDTITKPYSLESFNSILLKIDVQGFEKSVIQGSLEILPLVNALQLELSLVPLYENQVLLYEMIGILSELGFEAYAIIPGFTDIKTGRMLQVDGIFIRKP